jgi:hypothetical protein
VLLLTQDERDIAWEIREVDVDHRYIIHPPGLARRVASASGESATDPAYLKGTACHRRTAHGGHTASQSADAPSSSGSHNERAPAMSPGGLRRRVATGLYVAETVGLGR